MSSNITEKTSIDSIINAYNELSDVISNEEIASFIDDNKEELSKSGINKNTLSVMSTVLKTFDAETVIDIIQNDINLDEAAENSNNTEDIFNTVIENTTFFEKIQISLKLLFSNGYIRLLLLLSIVLFIYSLIITGIIFKKAGIPSFVTLIPIYRYAIYLKLYNFSPWLILLIFVPIIGWLALASISIIGRFELSKNFGHGGLFGLGLLILPVFFKSYIALSQDHLKKEE